MGIDRIALYDPTINEGYEWEIIYIVSQIWQMSELNCSAMITK